jgi:heat shock protein HslJ
MGYRFFLSFLLLALTGCTALFAVPPPAVVGTLWEVVELQGEPFSAPDGVPFTLLLQSDGHMRVYAGCNSLSGDYQYRTGRDAEGVLRVGPFAERKKQCSPELMHLEKEVVRAMEGASSYLRLDASSLSLRNPIHVTLIRFRALAANGTAEGPAAP